MGHESKIIQELEFILTHPACTVRNLEQFYNTCLFVYESVPLLSIIGFMQKKYPLLLDEWATVNVMVKNLISELEPHKDKKTGGKAIEIDVNLAGTSPNEKGIFQVVWTSDLPNDSINMMLKKNRIVVKDQNYGTVQLLGLSLLEEQETKYVYNLYLKKGGK